MPTIEEIREFLAERPLLTDRGLSKESDLSEGMIGKVMRGKIKLTPKTWAKLKPVLIKYGLKI